MPGPSSELLDLPYDAHPDPDAYVRAAMEWHFDPETGSPFWVERAARFGFDPRTDIGCLEDLRHFPDLAAEMRHARPADLIPRGYGGSPDVVGVFESGGTTGPPKRVVVLRDWFDRLLGWSNAQLDAHGFPRGVDWLGLVPTGPHFVGEFFRRSAATHGRRGLTVDLDPRWVKRLIADGRPDEAAAYAEHVVDQAAHLLRTLDPGVVAITPPLLDRLVRRDDLLDLVTRKVRAVRWGGTRLDPDARAVYRTQILPDVVFAGNYGSTMILGVAGERPGLGADDPCVFDAPGPAVTFSVVDPATGDPVPHGARGQVVTHHLSRSFLLPNNLERDIATRTAPPPGGYGDSVADVAPVATFEDRAVIEGVY